MSAVEYQYLLTGLLVIAAGVIRGFTGFGAALLLVPALVLLFGAAEAVPIVVLMNIAVGLQLVPSARFDVEWREIVPLVTAAVLFIPLGAWALVAVDPDLVRRGIAGVILILIGMMTWPVWPRIQFPRGISTNLSVGAVSGVLSGVAGVGGPPLTLYWMAQKKSPSTLRANMIVTSTIFHVISGIAYLSMGLVDRTTLLRFAVLLPLFVVGAYAGAGSFRRIPVSVFKPIVVCLLVVVSVVTLFA